MLYFGVRWGVNERILKVRWVGARRMARDDEKRDVMIVVLSVVKVPDIAGRTSLGRIYLYRPHLRTVRRRNRAPTFPLNI